jgi:hypothetical protein
MVHDRKKTQKSGLTGSRKDRPNLFDILDEMHACCRTIATVAALLETSRSELLHRQVVPDAGTLIVDAVHELKALLETLEKKPR